jgi:hypothetical protein
VTSQRELSGILFKNDRKTTDKHPDYKGRATIDRQELYISAWIKEGRNGKFMSLSFKSPADQRESASNGHRAPMDDEDLPFQLTEASNT